MTRKERFEKTITYFLEHMPIAETELEYENPYQLLVAVILSAQCTDKRVNIVTRPLFQRFPDARDLMDADVAEVFEYIRSVTYPNNKAKHLIGMAKILYNDFNNVVPSDIVELQTMPGVGRKTANVIASVVYEKPTMAVDTHVFRVAERVGLSYRSKTPLTTEKQLVEHIPEEYIAIAHHWLILHGRYTCVARTPKCKKCGLKEWCKFYIQQEKKKA